MMSDDRWLLAVLGAVGLAGGTVWLLNPRLGTDAVTARLRDDGIELVIHSPGCEPSLAGFSGRTIVSTALPDMVADARGAPVPRLARRSGLVILTAGTTSTPSAVRLRRRWSAPLTALALVGATGVSHGRPTLLCAPLFHGYGLAVTMLCLAAGSPLVVSSALPGVGAAQLDKDTPMARPTTDTAETRLDWGASMAAIIAHERVQTVIAVPSQLRSLARHLDAHPGVPTGAVRSIVSGSDRLDEPTIRTLTRHFGPVVTNFYGTTEAGTLTMITGPALAAQPSALGRPVAGVRLRIVDASGRVLRRGQTGFVHAVSPVAAFGAGWRGAFTTSDLGWLDDCGSLYLAGRAGPVQRLGGEFVDLSLVESTLAAHPGIASARAWLVPDEAMGQRVAAAVVVLPGREVSVDELRRGVRTRLGPPAVPVSIDVEQSAATSAG